MTDDFNRIAIGDCREVLPTLPAGAFRCCVTSPPYWGLRDYGHADQIGLEPTPEEYVATLVGVFREVRRVLADDGTLWLNIGDSYGAMGGDTFIKGSASKRSAKPEDTKAFAMSKSAQAAGAVEKRTGLRPKNLVGIPWRVAFALQSDGWYLRSDIIWAKPNPMPESVTDRPTKAHEYVFLLSKSERYVFEQDAVSEKAGGGGRFNGSPTYAALDRNDAGRRDRGKVDTRNIRTVWNIATQPYDGAHFATMPPKLAERCILAGSKLGDAVLDPFFGSGTVGQVAEQLGRRWLGIELNHAYEDLASARTAQSGLRFGDAT